MAELMARSPLEGMGPQIIGTVTLAETDMGTLTSIAPFKGQEAAAGAALGAAHGLPWPEPLRTTAQGDARAIWFGRDLILLAGPAPDATLHTYAALTDQSDAWSCVQLSGARVEQVLARLVPIDVDASTFEPGHAVRTQIQHMNGALLRIDAHSFIILVFRSMAGTLLHDLQRAMESVAARG